MKYTIYVLGILLVLMSHWAESSQLTYSDYAKLPEKSMVVISPSATKLAYRQVADGRDILIVLDLIKGTLIRAVNIEGFNPDNIYFIDDNRLIAVVSQNSRMFGYRGRYDVSAAFSFDITTGEMHQLMTAGYGIYQGQVSLGSIIGLSADKDYAYMPAWENDSTYSLLKVSLTKKKKPRRFKKGTSDTTDFFVGENGKLLARERYHNKKNLHRLEAWQDGKWVNIFTEETEIKQVSFVGVTPDRQSLVMIRQDETHGRWAYYTISLKDGAISKPLFSRADRDVETVLTDINRVVYGVRYSGFISRYEFFDEKLTKKMKQLNDAFPESSLTITDYTPDWSSIIFNMSGAGNSGQYIRYQGEQLRLLTHIRPNIKTEHVNHVQQTSYKARDGLAIPTLLTWPKNQTSSNLPAIMLPHGGPESYDKIGFDWLAQYFASQGYLVIQPQFRGSSGFGANHLRQGRGEWGRKMQDDLTDAVNWLVKEGNIDAERVCIVGASYGGYAALAGAAFTPDVYKCVVAINGVADVEKMLKTEKRQHGKHHWVVSYWDNVISNGNVESDHLEKISPVNFAKNITAPVLLIHGENDLIVPFYQSEDMFDAMEDANKKVTFVELKKGNHHLSKANNRAKALEAIDKFIKEHL